jgi:hypothetical protein
MHQGKNWEKILPADRSRENEKAPFPELFPVAGAGFEPATSGL